jgi:hypothetical protein
LRTVSEPLVAGLDFFAADEAEPADEPDVDDPDDGRPPARFAAAARADTTGICPLPAHRVPVLSSCWISVCDTNPTATDFPQTGHFVPALLAMVAFDPFDRLTATSPGIRFSHGSDAL